MFSHFDTPCVVLGVAMIRNWWCLLFLAIGLGAAAATPARLPLSVRHVAAYSNWASALKVAAGASKPFRNELGRLVDEFGYFLAYGQNDPERVAVVLDHDGREMSQGIEDLAKAMSSHVVHLKAPQILAEIQTSSAGAGSPSGIVTVLRPLDLKNLNGQDLLGPVAEAVRRWNRPDSVTILDLPLAMLVQESGEVVHGAGLFTNLIPAAMESEKAANVRLVFTGSRMDFARAVKNKDLRLDFEVLIRKGQMRYFDRGRLTFGRNCFSVLYTGN